MTDDVSGERATGTPNTIYDLSSVLFHALEGGASYDTYIEDAEREGDEELADFFRRVRDEDSMRADEAQRLLAERTPTATESIAAPMIGGVEGAATSMAGGTAAGDLPGTEPIREDVSTARTGEVPPPPEEVPPERTGEIPTAEEVPPPRTEEVPRAEEVPSGIPPQAPPGDVQSEPSPEPPPRTEEAPPPDREREREREENRGLLDRAMDALRGHEEEPSREERPRRGEGPESR